RRGPPRRAMHLALPLQEPASIRARRTSRRRIRAWLLPAVTPPPRPARSRADLASWFRSCPGRPLARGAFLFFHAEGRYRRSWGHATVPRPPRDQAHTMLSRADGRTSGGPTLACSP